MNIIDNGTDRTGERFYFLVMPLYGPCFIDVLIELGSKKQALALGSVLMFSRQILKALDCKYTIKELYF